MMAKIRPPKPGSEEISDNATLINDFFEDLSTRIGPKQAGYDSEWMIELVGGTIIEPTAFEPDPNTHRSVYYYNAITNVLYKKVTSRNEKGILVATWHKTSQ